MQEKQLIKVAMVVTMFGLFSLFAIWTFARPEEAAIGSLQDFEKEDVRIKGTVLEIRSFENLAVLTVAEIQSVDVVVFDKKQLKAKQGDNVTITGQLKDYRGRKEVIAEQIRVANS